MNILVQLALNYARNTWNSAWGLISALCVLNYLLLSQCKPNNPYVLALFIILPSLFLVGFWLLNTKRFPYKRKQVFAISIKPPDETAGKILQQALDQVKYDIDQLNLSEHIEIREIEHTQLKNRDDVRKLTKKRNVQMVLWGIIQHGCLNGIEVFHICNVVYSVRIWNIWKENESWDQFEYKLNFLMKQKEWIIHEHNSLQDVREVARNLSEVFLATLAISLSTKLDDIDDCIAISEKLIPYLVKHIPQEKRKVLLDANTKELKGPLNVLKYGVLIDILQNAYYLKGWALYEGQVHKDKALNFLQKALEIKPFDAKCHELSARIYYELNELEHALMHTEKLKMYQKTNSSYFYNMAYLSLRKGEYTEAIHFYENLRKWFRGKSREKEKAIEVINFIEEDRTKLHDCHYLQFAIGIITYNFISKMEGIEILDLFVSKYGNIEYEPLINKACYIIHRGRNGNRARN